MDFHAFLEKFLILGISHATDLTHIKIGFVSPLCHLIQVWSLQHQGSGWLFPMQMSLVNALEFVQYKSESQLIQVLFTLLLNVLKTGSTLGFV
jgi:hypothetical protein